MKLRVMKTKERVKSDLLRRSTSKFLFSVGMKNWHLGRPDLSYSAVVELYEKYIPNEIKSS